MLTFLHSHGGGLIGKNIGNIDLQLAIECSITSYLVASWEVQDLACLELLVETKSQVINQLLLILTITF